MREHQQLTYAPFTGALSGATLQHASLLCVKLFYNSRSEFGRAFWSFISFVSFCFLIPTAVGITPIYQKSPSFRPFIHLVFGAFVDTIYSLYYSIRSLDIQVCISLALAFFFCFVFLFFFLFYSICRFH
ncbi:hypothetical protein P168DRAFT_16616 [Aspergillus campestris IBT 28561]|uniref:Uncharacterized protein n=1 Tax=Aspergillus campestris (strain IBT 28561) TaxID=1392248 RepID=A0A2I1DEY9_ASPC2|nr:uncharacterized protein P168DRAFT_16616 [Aspergillus campestris IBT 28561]PKY08437.1 hypothetical protein P168DRAFT_16616 [Aspergillus campestris IBT 28561]